MCTRRVTIKIKSGYKVHHQLGGFLYPEGNKVGIVGNFDKNAFSPTMAGNDAISCRAQRRVLSKHIVTVGGCK